MISLVIHLLIIVLGFAALIVALISGDWRFLLISIAAYFITVKT